MTAKADISLREAALAEPGSSLRQDSDSSPRATLPSGNWRRCWRRSQAMLRLQRTHRKSRSRDPLGKTAGPLKTYRPGSDQEATTYDT